MADSASFFVRTDSNTANNPQLNLVPDNQIPSFEITFIPDPAAGADGDLVLETDGVPTGVDPDTLVVIDGVEYNFRYEVSGTLPANSSQFPDTFNDAVTVIIVVEDYPTAGETSRLFFLPELQATEAEMNDFGLRFMTQPMLTNLIQNPHRPALPIRAFIQSGFNEVAARQKARRDLTEPSRFPNWLISESLVRT